MATVAQPGGLKRISRDAVARLPFASSQDTDFEQAYRFEMLSSKVALLTIATFSWPDKSLFYAFTETMFTLHPGPPQRFAHARADPA